FLDSAADERCALVGLALAVSHEEVAEFLQSKGEPDDHVVVLRFERRRAFADDEGPLIRLLRGIEIALAGQEVARERVSTAEEDRGKVRVVVSAALLEFADASPKAL